MKTKICKKCNIEKNIENFRLKKDKCGKYYRYSYCKECEKVYYNQIRKPIDKKYQKNHKEEINKKMRIRTQNMTLEEKENKRAYNKKYQKNNKTRLNEARKIYESKKRKNDKIYKTKCQIRHMINISFNKKGLNKSKHTEEIIGMPLNNFYNYLLQTFKNNYGYDWNGIEKVHIDHIIPLATANTEEEVTNLCYYTNLQLLKEKDNLKKKDKLKWELSK